MQISRLALAKRKIEREKQRDKVRHDRMLDRARVHDTRKLNKRTLPEGVISLKMHVKEYNKAVEQLRKVVKDNDSSHPEKYVHEVAKEYLHVNDRDLLNYYYKKYSD